MGQVIAMERRYPTYEEYERAHPGISPLEYHAVMANEEQRARFMKTMMEVNDDA